MSENDFGKLMVIQIMVKRNILKARCSGWDIYTGIFHIPEKSQQNLSWIYLHINK